MLYLSEFDRRCRRRRVLWFAVVCCAGFLALTLADASIYRVLRIERWEEWKGRDWVQLLRSFGYVPTWCLIGAGVWLASERRGASRGGRERVSGRALGIMMPAAGLLGGASAELLKVIVRRHRPTFLLQGTYSFDWIDGAYAGRGLGLASSHAAVAFGAAFVVWGYSRRPGYLAMAIAAGCALTRLMAGAHFATDVYVAALLGYGVARLVWKLGGTGAWRREYRWHG